VGLGTGAGDALAEAVVSVGEGEAEPVEDAAGDEGDADAERAGVAEEGVGDGVGVGPSANAGVPRKDTPKTTARSGGARYRWTRKSNQKTAAGASESGHKSPEQAGEGRPR
jgi:hypothetical protein